MFVMRKNNKLASRKKNFHLRAEFVEAEIIKNILVYYRGHVGK